jgi:hypothetical protein
MVQCPHLSAMASAEIRPFPATWLVAPLTVEAKAQTAPLPGLADQPSTPVVSFLHIFGISGEVDKRWRREARRLPTS